MFEKIILTITFKDILDFIVNPFDSEIYIYLRFIFIIISLVLLAFAIPLFLISSWRKYRYTRDIKELVTFRPFNVKEGYKQWAKITKKLDSGRESEYKLAVIEADSLLEQVLETMGHTGDLMEEKLEKIDSILLSSKEKILEAHKVRNNVVHNPDFELSLDEAKKTIETYEEALRNLEAF